MPSGHDNQLTKQVGEYLVAAELARRGLLSATFNGNVPHYDVLAADRNGRRVLIQVKAIKRGNWQFNAGAYIDVTFEGSRQVLGETKRCPVPGLMCVFVLVSGTGRDRFFIFPWEDLANLISSRYRAYIDRKHGVRPRKPDSLHSKLGVEDLVKYENRWEGLIANIGA